MQKENIITVNTVENTLLNKERFNPYQTGHGFYKDKKHPSRTEKKQKLRKEIENAEDY